MVLVVQGEQIAKTFLNLVGWARGGHLTVVTPFINDFHIGSERVSRMISRLKMTSPLKMMTAPPQKPHANHRTDKLFRCNYCKSIAQKIILLDYYEGFSQELLIKQNLHAKVFIAENYKKVFRCLAGSVNLTRYAFYQHCELGIYFENQTIIKEILSFVQLWKSGRYGPRAEDYRIWRKAFLKKYPHIKYLIEKRDLWFKWN